MFFLPLCDDTVPGELKAAEATALLKAAGYCGAQPANGIWVRSRNPHSPRKVSSLLIPVAQGPVATHSHPPQTAIALPSKWPLIRMAVPVAWLGRFDLTLFEAIKISLGSCSIGVSEIEALMISQIDK